MTTGITTLQHTRPRSERVIERLLFGAAAVGVVTTFAIIAVLALNTFEFFLQSSCQPAPARGQPSKRGQIPPL